MYYIHPMNSVRVAMIWLLNFSKLEKLILSIFNASALVYYIHPINSVWVAMIWLLNFSKLEKIFLSIFNAYCLKLTIHLVPKVFKIFFLNLFSNRIQILESVSFTRHFFITFNLEKMTLVFPPQQSMHFLIYKKFRTSLFSVYFLLFPCPKNFSQFFSSHWKK